MEIEIQDSLGELEEAVDSKDVERIRACVSDLLWDYSRGQDYIGVEEKYREEIRFRLKHTFQVLRKLKQNNVGDKKVCKVAKNIMNYIIAFSRDDREHLKATRAAVSA